MPPDVMDPADRARAFLILHEGTDLCDECLARAVGIPVAEAPTVLARLAKSVAILRDHWRCTACRAQSLVTRAIPNATFALSRRSRHRLRRIA
jgi:hypothetical protein